MARHPRMALTGAAGFGSPSEGALAEGVRELVETMQEASR